MRAEVLVPPFAMAGALAGGSSWLVGGPVWGWVLAGWILSAPLTLLWAAALVWRESKPEHSGSTVEGKPVCYSCFSLLNARR